MSVGVLTVATAPSTHHTIASALIHILDDMMAVAIGPRRQWMGTMWTADKHWMMV